MEPTEITTVESYKTSDGRTFVSKDAATRHAHMLAVRAWYEKNPLVDYNSGYAVSYQDIYDWAVRNNIVISDGEHDLIPVGDY